jgi:hypothetical protein
MAGGAPRGNKNAAKGRKARKSLEMAIERMHDDPDDYFDFKKRPLTEKVRPLVEIWFRAIDEAKNGNIQATNTIMDRLDGKAGQNIDIVADIQNRTVEDLSDEELLSIAQHGSTGTSEEAEGEGESSSFY